MALTLYVATTNPGKLRDFAEAAKTKGVRFLLLPGLAQIPAPAENASTFEENAVAKAIAYSLHSPGEIVLADDSGLDVDALDGAPGVRSARFAADAGWDSGQLRGISTDERNNLLLLERMRGVPRNLRTARYRCALAAAKDGSCIHVAEGAVEGSILEAPRGDGGFGYDPLFFLTELGRTMAEIELEEKNRLSHRGRALRALLRQLGS